MDSLETYTSFHKFENFLSGTAVIRVVKLVFSLSSTGVLVFALLQRVTSFPHFLVERINNGIFLFHCHHRYFHFLVKRVNLGTFLHTFIIINMSIFSKKDK